jgi:carboxypeptidase C (cathepsin A)
VTKTFACRCRAAAWPTALALCAALAALAALAPDVARAAEPAPDPRPADAGKKAAEPPKAEQSVTQHSVSIGGKPIAYTATAGTLLLRNEKDENVALVGYTYYAQRDVPDRARRPITFAYNGGPGSSSIWLHMGALGPRRIVTSDAGPTPPAPYRTVDNSYSLLDKTDLVMIDPVGTGLSHAVGEAKDKDFWGVDADINSVARFIEQFVNDNGRWNSPKYLLGESYGTTRSGGIVDHLQNDVNMAFNGVILVSVACDLESIFVWPGNDRPYPFYLPTYAAVAAFHKALPHPPSQLGPFLDEVRKFAVGDYAAALLKGDALTEQERDAVAERLHQYTGLAVDYIKKAKLRVSEGEFTQELLREHHETVGRLDARFLGITYDPLAREAEYDPQSAAISSAFTAAFLDYLHGELKFGQGKTYRIVNGDVFQFWDFKHRISGQGFPTPVANTALDLAHALGYNPHLRVLALNGIYDLATPFFATESSLDHLGLGKELRSHIENKYYDAGHMMYVHEPSLVKFKSDIAAFIDATSK